MDCTVHDDAPIRGESVPASRVAARSPLRPEQCAI